jgi:hypothetical protein
MNRKQPMKDVTAQHIGKIMRPAPIDVPSIAELRAAQYRARRGVRKVRGAK